MNDGFSNIYDDKLRADAYAELEFPGTYYLAFSHGKEIPFNGRVRVQLAKRVTCTSAIHFSFIARRGPILAQDHA